MKKNRIITWLLVFATLLSVSACTKNEETEPVETESETETTVATSSSSSEETTTSETADPWVGHKDAKTAVGATAIADIALGMSVDDVIYDHIFIDFWNRSVSFNSDSTYQAMIPDEAYFIEGIAFKKIYLWKDGTNVSKVTFATRESENLPMTEDEAAGAEADMNFDSIKAKIAIVEALNNAFGDFTKSDAELPDSKESGCYIWEHNGTQITVTYGVDCYGVKGNNEFKIDVYSSDFTGSDLDPADAEFKLMVTRMYKCLGQDLPTAKAMFTDIMGVPLEREQNDDSVYYYHIDKTIEGIEFNQAIFKLNPSGNVYEIYLVNDTSSTEECEKYYDALYQRLENVYGKVFIPTNSREYEGVITGSLDGCWCIIGTFTTANYNRFNLIFNNESLRDD